MDEENLGKDRSLGHIEILAGDYVKQDDSGEYLAHEQKQPIAGPLRMAGHAAAKGTLNYTCSFYPTIPTWDPDEDEEEKEQEKVSTPNGVSRTASVKTGGTDASKGHARVASGASGPPVARSETVGTIASMKTASSDKASEGDLAKALERNEEQQDETTPEKKPIQKLKLTADDIQQYGKLHRRNEDIGRFSWLSWSSPTCSSMSRILNLLVRSMC
jgi:hypothetical protein